MFKTHKQITSTDKKLWKAQDAPTLLKKLDKGLQNTKTIALATLMLSSLVTGCAQKYKSSWNCANPEGIGCSSIFYADMIARKHIILNEDSKTRVLSKKKQSGKTSATSRGKRFKKSVPKLVIKQHYSDFKKVKTKEVEID